MAPRLQLQSLLEAFTENVYYQPPSNVTLKYPCIIYKREGDMTRYAGNRRYSHLMRYEVTVIDRNPDGPLWDGVADLPLCDFDRHFTADNLNHDVFTLFF
jgi:hypothetical protein